MYLDCTDYLVNFELFYRNMLNLGILSVKNLAFLKTLTKETALCSYRIYNHNVPQYLSKEEFLAWKNLPKNKDTVIQISDKGDFVETLDKAIM